VRHRVVMGVLFLNSSCLVFWLIRWRCANHDLVRFCQWVGVFVATVEGGCQR